MTYLHKSTLAQAVCIALVFTQACGGDVELEDVTTQIPQSDTSLDLPDADLQDFTDDGDDTDLPVPVELLFAPNPTCQTNGCVRELRYSLRVSRDQLQGLIEPGLDIENGYQLFTLRYKTGDLESTATLAIPDASPPPEGFGVVVNAHGTVGLDDICRLSDTVSGGGLAGLFGARGTISIAPDYPGLGTPGLHPYLVSDVAGPAVLDAARAALQMADHLQIPSSERVALVGLSQGGHAVLTAAAQVSTWAPELNVVAVGAAGPASMYLEHWALGFTFSGPHIVFPTMLLAAWRDHYRFEKKMFLEEALPTIEAASSEACVWSPTTSDIPLWNERIGEDPQSIFEPDLIQAMADKNLAQYPQLADAFEANRLKPFATTIPLQIWQGTDDHVVLYAHTAEMVADFEEAGMTVDFQVVEGAGHVDLAFGFLAFQERRTAESIAWIKSHLSP